VNNTEPGSRAGSRFGPYRLERLLGHGVVGEVYRAEDTRNDEMVALKLISESFSGDEAFRSRLEDEAEAAGQLTEPHVVSIRAYGEIDDVLYLETDLIGGTDLAALLADGGPLSPPRAVAIVRQIAAALDAAHNADVIHRDVKPDKILVTADDLAYLMDFGVAAAIADPATRADPATGTVRYMAPERLTGEQVTHLADIYSLACVLAECLGGVPPFSADTVSGWNATGFAKAALALAAVVVLASLVLLLDGREVLQLERTQRMAVAWTSVVAAVAAAVMVGIRLVILPHPADLLSRQIGLYVAVVAAVGAVLAALGQIATQD